MVKTIAGMICGVLLAGVGQASAQVIAWDDRGFVNLNGGGQSGSQNVNRQFTFSIYEEEASVEVQRSIKGGGFFDLTAGYRIRSNWGAGFSFMRRSANSDGALTASIPDPILFERPRSVPATVGGMKYQESLFAPLFIYVLPMTDKIDVMVMAGPSVGRVSHELVESVSMSETAGGPQVTPSRVTIKKSFVGFHGGVDVRYLLTQLGKPFGMTLGVGGFLRYNGAGGNLSGDVKADIGGFQAGGGLRVKF